MNTTIRDGIHKVKITRAELGESNTGKERIELDFQTPDGAKAFRHMYLTERARPYTFETLKGFGIECDDEDYIDHIDVLVGKGCKIKVMTPVGNDATPEVVSIWPLDEDRKKPSQEELRARIKKKHTETRDERDEYDEREEPPPKAAKPITPPPVPSKSSSQLTAEQAHELDRILDEKLS